MFIYYLSLDGDHRDIHPLVNALLHMPEVDDLEHLEQPDIGDNRDLLRLVITDKIAVDNTVSLHPSVVVKTLKYTPL